MGLTSGVSNRVEELGWCQQSKGATWVSFSVYIVSVITIDSLYMMFQLYSGSKSVCIHLMAYLEFSSFLRLVISNISCCMVLGSNRPQLSQPIPSVNNWPSLCCVAKLWCLIGILITFSTYDFFSNFYWLCLAVTPFLSQVVATE